jgi:hypothetical protein
VNTTASLQGIKRGSRLQSSGGVVVRTLRGVLVPANGRATVSVRADEGGTKQNLEPQRLVLPALSTAAQKIIWAEISTSLRGGTDRTVHIVRETDVQQAVEQLRADGEAFLRTQIAQTASASPSSAAPVFAPPALRRVVVDDVQATPAVGTEADQVTVRAQVGVEALTVDAASLHTFLTGLLAERAGEGKVLADVLSLDSLRVIDTLWERGQATVSLHMETRALPALDPSALRSQLRGRTAEEAEAFLRALGGVRSAEVRLRPPWVRRVPTLERNVTIEVRPE